MYVHGGFCLRITRPSLRLIFVDFIFSEIIADKTSPICSLDLISRQGDAAGDADFTGAAAAAILAQASAFGD